MLQKQFSKRIKTLAVSAFAFFISLNTYSQEILPPDTSVKTTRTVEVISEKIQYTNLNKLNSIYTFSAKDIEKIAAFQINEVLSKAPGIYIKNYGSASGLKTISLRGTNSMQSLIMLDGVAVNSSRSSSIDLSILPASFIREAEIIRGGASSDYGSSAVGGAVNLIMDGGNDNQIKIGQSFASFGEYRSDIGIKHSGENYSFSLAGEYLSSAGDYEFEHSEFGHTYNTKRINSQMEKFSAFAQSSYMINDANKLSFKALYTNSKRGVPGAVLQGAVESSQADLDEDNLLLILSESLNFSENEYIKFTASAAMNNSLYKDNDSLSFDLLKRNQYYDRNIKLNIRTTIELLDFIIYPSAEYTFTDLEGDMLDPSVNSFVKRQTAALSLGAEKVYSLSEEYNLTILPAVRYDVSNESSYFISSSAGIGIKNIMSGFGVNLQYSENFRLPSFNELYYFNYGTKDLKPEKSQSLNLSVSAVLFSNNKIDLSLFYIDTKDQIAAVQKSPILSSAANIGNVVTAGGEITLFGSYFNDLLNYTLSYTLLSAKDKGSNSLNYNKEIVYTPNEIFTASVYISKYDFTFGSSADYTSHRFAMPDNSYNSMLRAYSLFNFYLAYNFELFGVSAQARADIMNAFNEEYQVIRNYPMPGRSFRFSINLKY